MRVAGLTPARARGGGWRHGRPADAAVVVRGERSCSPRKSPSMRAPSEASARKRLARAQTTTHRLGHARACVVGWMGTARGICARESLRAGKGSLGKGPGRPTGPRASLWSLPQAISSTCVRPGWGRRWGRLARAPAGVLNAGFHRPLADTQTHRGANGAVLSAFRRVGFVDEGRLPGKLLVDRENHDHVVMGCFRHEIRG